MVPEPAKQRITVRDIAREMGLHHTTISLALRNSPKLRPETRAKIQKVAKKLGYKPDPMLSALNVYRNAKRPVQHQATLAWINNWIGPDDLLKIPTYHKYYTGACDRAKQLGYIIEEFRLHEPGMTGDRMLNILKARNIQGVLLPPQMHSRMDLSLDCQELAVVAFGYSLQPPVFNVVANHHTHTMNLMLTHLQEMGYERIGFYAPSDWDEKVENAFGAGLKFAQWKNAKIVQIPACIGEPALLAKWLRKHHPDVVISWNVAEHFLRELGYDIPKDIGFASLDLDDSVPHLSGAQENNFYIGQKAVDVLIGLLHRGERGIPQIPTRLLVESSWHSGETLRLQKP